MVIGEFMCKCDTNTCPRCDPGIEAYYQMKVKEAKEAAAACAKSFGGEAGEMDYQHFLGEAKEIWWEYCALKESSKLEEELDKDTPEDPSQWTY
jgi:hypothetical protein